MKLSEVSKEDGVALATLINVLKAARFDNISGQDMEAFFKAKQWVHALATNMAEHLKALPKSEEAPKPIQGMKLKSMGSLSSIGKAPTKKKK